MMAILMGREVHVLLHRRKEKKDLKHRIKCPDSFPLTKCTYIQAHRRRVYASEPTGVPVKCDKSLQLVVLMWP